MTDGPTLADVARHSGVSKATVSKVFNGRSDVADGTAARVRASARALGYRKRARPAGQGRITVWIALDGVSTFYTPVVLGGLLVEAADSDTIAVVTQAHGTRPSTRIPGTPQWMTEAHGAGAQAFVLVTTAVTPAVRSTAATLRTPFVVVDPLTRPPAGVVTVGATNFRGGVEATEHLVRLGHRRIAFVGANPDSVPGADRLAGFMDTLRREGIPYDPSLVVPGRFATDDGRAAIDLLARPDRPTAVFAASDAVAFGIFDACRKLGLRIPEDLSVVGFDDAIGADVSAPHLTTVRQPLAEMGRLALRICVEAVRTGEPLAPPVELTTSLVERDSTCPPAVVRSAAPASHQA